MAALPHIKISSEGMNRKVFGTDMTTMNSALLAGIVVTWLEGQQAGVRRGNGKSIVPCPSWWPSVKWCHGCRALIHTWLTKLTNLVQRYLRGCK